MFPDTIQEFNRKMIPIIEVIFKSKLLMEKNYNLIINDISPLSYGFNSSINANPIPPCFHIAVNPNAKKRKRDQSSTAESQQ